MTNEQRTACEGIISTYQSFFDKSGICVADLGKHGYLVVGDFNDNEHPEFEEYCKTPEKLLDFVDELWCLDQISDFMEDANYNDRTFFLENSKDLSAKDSLELIPAKHAKRIQKKRMALLRKCRRYPGAQKVYNVAVTALGVVMLVLSIASLVYTIWNYLDDKCEKFD